MEPKRKLAIDIPEIEIDENFQPKEKPTVERALYFKDKGNNSFKYKDYKNAINYYDMALDTIVELETANKNHLKEGEFEDSKLSSPHILINPSELVEIKSNLYHNMSACHQMKKEIKEALYYNSKALEINENYSKALYKQVQLLLDLGEYSACISQYECNLIKLANPSDIKAFESLKLNIESKIESNKKHLQEDSEILDLIHLATISTVNKINGEEDNSNQITLEQENKLLVIAHSKFSYFKALIEKLNESFQMLNQSCFLNNQGEDGVKSFDLSENKDNLFFHFERFVFNIFSLVISKDKQEVEESYNLTNYKDRNTKKCRLYSNTLSSGKLLKFANLDKFLTCCSFNIDAAKLETLSKIFSFDTKCVVELCIKHSNFKCLCRLIDNTDADHNITSSFYSKIIKILMNNAENTFLFKTMIIKLFNLYKDEREFLFSHNFSKDKNKWFWYSTVQTLEPQKFLHYYYLLASKQLNVKFVFLTKFFRVKVLKVLYDLLSHSFYDQILKILTTHNEEQEELFEIYKSDLHHSSVGNLICKFINVASFKDSFVEYYPYIDQLLNLCSSGEVPQDSKEILILSKLSLLQEFSILHENDKNLMKLTQITCNVFNSFNLQNINEEQVDSVDTILQSLGLQSMLISMKSQIVSYLTMQSDSNKSNLNEEVKMHNDKLLSPYSKLIQIQDLISDNKYVSLEYSYLLLILNLIRSNDYDIIPSRSYEYCKSGKNQDFAYQQQIELKRLFRNNTGKNVLSFLMLSDCIYDYGEEEYVDSKIRNGIISKINYFSYLKSCESYPSMIIQNYSIISKYFFNH